MLAYMTINSPPVHSRAQLPFLYQTQLGACSYIMLLTLFITSSSGYHGSAPSAVIRGFNALILFITNFRMDTV